MQRNITSESNNESEERIVSLCWDIFFALREAFPLVKYKIDNIEECKLKFGTLALFNQEIFSEEMLAKFTRLDSISQQTTHLDQVLLTMADRAKNVAKKVLTLIDKLQTGSNQSALRSMLVITSCTLNNLTVEIRDRLSRNHNQTLISSDASALPYNYKLLLENLKLSKRLATKAKQLGFTLPNQTNYYISEIADAMLLEFLHATNQTEKEMLRHKALRFYKKYNDVISPSIYYAGKALFSTNAAYSMDYYRKLELSITPDSGKHYYMKSLALQTSIALTIIRNIMDLANKCGDDELNLRISYLEQAKYYCISYQQAHEKLKPLIDNNDVSALQLLENDSDDTANYLQLITTDITMTKAILIRQLESASVGIDIIYDGKQPTHVTFTIPHNPELRFPLLGIFYSMGIIAKLNKSDGGLTLIIDLDLLSPSLLKSAICAFETKYREAQSLKIPFRGSSSTINTDAIPNIAETDTNTFTETQKRKQKALNAKAKQIVESPQEPREIKQKIAKRITWTTQHGQEYTYDQADPNSTVFKLYGDQPRQYIYINTNLLAFLAENYPNELQRLQHLCQNGTVLGNTEAHSCWILSGTPFTDAKGADINFANDKTILSKISNSCSVGSSSSSSNNNNNNNNNNKAISKTKKAKKNKKNNKTSMETNNAIYVRGKCVGTPMRFFGKLVARKPKESDSTKIYNLLEIDSAKSTKDTKKNI